MQFRNFAVQGPLEIRPDRIADDRGYFAEVFRRDEFSKHIADIEFVQDNESYSAKAGTIRGIHFQVPPAAQAKLVRCIAGEIFDVAVDLRTASQTFGEWVSIVLSPQHNNQLWIPVGFGHGFCTLQPNSIISYRVTNYYSPENDKGVAWDDPAIGIDWPDLGDPQTLSPRDRNQPRLCDLPAYFSMKEN